MYNCRHIKVMSDSANGNQSTLTNSATELLTLVQDKGLEVVEEFLKADHGNLQNFLEATDNGGRTPLSVACELKRGDVVNLLLQYGADSSSCVEPGGKTPLHYACDHEEWNAGIVRQLLQAGAKVDQQMTDGQTALHIASFHGNVEVVSLLLAHYADVNLVDSLCENALCKTKSAPVAKLLIHAGNDVDSNFGQPILCAVKKSLCDMVSLLIKSGCNLNHDPLMSIACREGSLGIIKELVQGRVAIKCHHLPIVVESSKCTPDTVEYVLSLGCDVNSIINSNKWRPIHAACSVASVQKVQLLLSHKAQVSGHFFPSLFKSIARKWRPFLFSVRHHPRQQSRDEVMSDVRVLMKLVHAAGAKIDHCDIKDLEEDFGDVTDPDMCLRQSLMEVLDKCLHQPRRLESLCRITVRCQIPANIDHHIQQLPLPANLKSYLQFDDILE